MPHLDALGLVCADLDTSMAFYRLLDVPFPATGESHVEAVLANGLRLMADTEEVVQSFSDWTPPTGGWRRVALAFACGSPGEVDTVHARMVAAGHASHVDPFDAPWGQRYATVGDPDGNPVDLFAALDVPPTGS